jgi:SPP1 family predicted phage head-tail adaptor
MTLLTERWYGVLAHEASGNEDGDRLFRVRILRDERPRAYDLAVIGGEPYLITRVFHGADDDSGEPISDLTLTTGPRIFSPVELVPASGQEPNLVAARATIAEVRSVTAEEYYKAQAAGMTVSVRVIVYIAEYADEAYVRYDGQTYLVRGKKLAGQRTELVCSAL